jgi:hypothetical protein
MAWRFTRRLELLMTRPAGGGDGSARPLDPFCTAADNVSLCCDRPTDRPERERSARATDPSPAVTGINDDAVGPSGEVAVADCPRNALAEQVEAWIDSLLRVASGAEPLPA